MSRAPTPQPLGPVRISHLGTGITDPTPQHEPRVPSLQRPPYDHPHELLPIKFTDDDKPLGNTYLAFFLPDIVIDSPIVLTDALRKMLPALPTKPSRIFDRSRGNNAAEAVAFALEYSSDFEDSSLYLPVEEESAPHPPDNVWEASSPHLRMEFHSQTNPRAMSEIADVMCKLYAALQPRTEIPRASAPPTASYRTGGSVPLPPTPTSKRNTMAVEQPSIHELGRREGTQLEALLNADMVAPVEVTQMPVAKISNAQLVWLLHSWSGDHYAALNLGANEVLPLFKRMCFNLAIVGTVDRAEYETIEQTMELGGQRVTMRMADLVPYLRRLPPAVPNPSLAHMTVRQMARAAAPAVFNALKKNNSRPEYRTNLARKHPHACLRFEYCAFDFADDRMPGLQPVERTTILALRALIPAERI